MNYCVSKTSLKIRHHHIVTQIITLSLNLLALQPYVGPCLLHGLCRFRYSRFFRGGVVSPTLKPKPEGPRPYLLTYQEFTLPPAYLSDLLGRREGDHNNVTAPTS
jgi:hypothetical protein